MHAPGLQGSPRWRGSAQAALQFVEVADVFEDLARSGRRLVTRLLVLGMTDKRTQLLTVGVGVFVDEAFKVLVITVDQAVPPALQVVEAFVVLAAGAVDLLEHRVDGVQVLVAHQFADERHMPFACAMSGVLAGFGQGFAQLIGQRQARQGIGLDRSQAFAEFDQRMQLALDLGFAFFAVEGVVV